MRSSFILLALPLSALAAEPEPLVRLGSDRFRQAEQVTAIAYSADGKRLATAEEQTICLWDAADGRLLRAIPGAEGRKFAAVHFDADGTALFAVARDEKRTATFYHLDPATGKMVTAVDLMRAGENDFFEPEACFSPDGTWVVARRGDGQEIAVMGTKTRRVVFSEQKADGKFYAAAFRPDGRVLAMSGSGGRVCLIDLARRVVTDRLNFDLGRVTSLAFAPDGTDLVGEVENPCRVVRFDARTGEVRWSQPAERAAEPAFSPDGKLLRYFGTTGGRDEPFRWHWLDAATGRAVGPPMDTGHGFLPATRPDGRVLAITGYYGHVSQWDLTTRKRIDEKSADPGLPVTELSFTGDGSKVRGWANGWYEWDVKTGKQTRLSPPLAIGASETAVASPDSRWLVSGSDTLVFAEVGRDRNRLALGTKGDVFRFLRTGHMIRRRDNNCVDIFDPGDGKAWNPGRWEPVLHIEANEGAVAASADGTIAVRVSPVGDHFRVSRWDVATGKPVGEWDGRLSDPSLMDKSHGWRAELSPDGRVLAVFFTYLAHPGMGFDPIEELHTALFDARTGRFLSGWWDLHFQADLAFSPDGRMVACYYPSGLGVDVREVATGERRTRRPCPPVHSAAFSPDGRWLALATGPTPVALWDLIGKAAGTWADQKPGDLWDGLASEDAVLAFNVIRTLRQHPTEAVAFLKERVKAPTAPAAGWVAGRIKALDAPQFRDREQATTDLAGVGEVIVPELRAGTKTASAEAHRRLEGLLEKVTTPSRETWRTIRACEALEGIGTPAARELLSAWAKGPPAATLTREGAESVERLAKRR